MIALIAKKPNTLLQNKMLLDLSHFMQELLNSITQPRWIQTVLYLLLQIKVNSNLSLLMLLAVLLKLILPLDILQNMQLKLFSIIGLQIMVPLNSL